MSVHLVIKLKHPHSGESAKMSSAAVDVDMHKEMEIDFYQFISSDQASVCSLKRLNGKLARETTVGLELARYTIDKLLEAAHENPDHQWVIE